MRQLMLIIILMFVMTSHATDVVIDGTNIKYHFETEISDSDSETMQNTSWPAHLKLCTVSDGMLLFFTPQQWISVKNKSEFDIVGIVIMTKSNPFVLALNDLGAFKPGKAKKKKYRNHMFTYDMAQTIIENRDEINRQLESFGGTPLSNLGYFMGKYFDKEFGVSTFEVDWNHCRQYNIVRTPSKIGIFIQRSLNS